MIQFSGGLNAYVASAIFALVQGNPDMAPWIVRLPATAGDVIGPTVTVDVDKHRLWSATQRRLRTVVATISMREKFGRW